MPGRGAGVGWIAATLAVAGCSAGGHVSSTVDYSGHALKLGAALSLTGAGDIYGPQEKNGIDLAVKDINAGGGVDGAKVEVKVDDDQSAADRGTEVFDNDIKDGVLGLIGPTLVNTARSAHPEAEKSKVATIAVSSPGLNVVGACPYPCTAIFRASLAEKSAIPANVRAAVSAYHPGSALVFYASDDRASTDAALLFQQALKDSAIPVSDSQMTAFPHDQSDFGAIVGPAVQRKADVWAITAPPAPAAALMAEARKQGFAGHFLGSDYMNSYDAAGRAGDAGKGTQVASGYFNRSTGAVNKAFAAAYQSAYGKPADEYAAQAYAAVQLFAEAARHAGLGFEKVGTDRVRLRDALSRVSIETPMGAFHFGPDHDARQKVWINAMDGTGTFINISVIEPS